MPSSPASETASSSRLDFDLAGLSWVDRDDFEDRLGGRLEAGKVSDDEAEILRSWRRDGYVVLPDKMDDELVQQQLDDYERYWRERPKNMLLLVEGESRFPEVPPRDELVHHHYRIEDIQDSSQAARQMILRALRATGADTPQPPEAENPHPAQLRNPR